MKKRHYTKALGLLVALYFLGLIGYTIHLSGRTMPFYTKVMGYASYGQGETPRLRFQLFGTGEMAPILGYSVEVALLQDGEAKRLVAKGRNDHAPYFDMVLDIGNLKPGRHSFLATIRHDSYGEERLPFSLNIKKSKPARRLNIYEPEIEIPQRKPLQIKSFSPPVTLHLIANNGLFVQSLNNDVLLVAETEETMQPVSGLFVTIKSGKDLLFEGKTDALGHARFPFYASKIGSELVKVRVRDETGKTHESSMRLAPPGSQIIADATRRFLPDGKKVQMKLKTLRPAIWFLDAFDKGDWIATKPIVIRGNAAELVEFALPDSSANKGLVQIQIAGNAGHPGKAWDIFFVQPLHGRSKAEAFDALMMNLPDKVAYGEKSAKRVREKYRAMKEAGVAIDIDAFADETFRRLEKGYLLIPEFINTSADRLRLFQESQKSKKTIAMVALGVSGLVVLSLIVLILLRENRRTQALKDALARSDDEDDLAEEALILEMQKKRLFALVAFLVLLVIGYSMALYLLATLDWQIGL